jgi:hypothetical protein
MCGGVAFWPSFYEPDGAWSEQRPGSGERARDGSFRSTSTEAATPSETMPTLPMPAMRSPRSCASGVNDQRELDEDACELCDEPLDMLACSQCGIDAFVRTCEHGGPRPIRVLEDALYCRTCRP